MIIKVIPNTLGTSVENRINGLSDYIHNPNQTRIDYLSDYITQLHASFSHELISEKCVYSNSRNFLDDNIEYQKIEMSQTASLNTRVDDPIVHIVGSFKKFEVPTTQQLEEQIDILSKHLKADDLQMQYALHMDTDNVHFHLIINRIHPYRKNNHNEHQAVDLGDGWILNAVHRAVAEIEAKQGWEPEPNPLFIYNSKTGECEKNINHISNPDALKISAKIRDQEHRHQQKSRLSKEMSVASNYQDELETIIQPILKEANSWQDWYQQLASSGISYERKRSGSIFTIRLHDQESLTFKASLFCNKQVTLKNLESRWGEFTPHHVDQIKIYQPKLNTTAQQTPHESSKISAYHLFQNEDFLVKELHDAYLKMKSTKDVYSQKRRSKYQDINFENEIYKYNKSSFLKQLQKKFPKQASDTIYTLLHYQHHTEQLTTRAKIRNVFLIQNQNLSQQTSEKLFDQNFLSRNFDSTQITSYADFLRFVSPTNPLLIQQQFLFDQRQSKNFIYQENPEIKNAKILFDSNDPKELIGIQNRYGILIFSNYSITRLEQCIKNLHPEHQVSVRGSSDFKNLFKMLSQHRSNEIQDTNKSRTLPALSKLSSEQLKAGFRQLYQHFKTTGECQSTALIKTGLLLNCCGINMSQLKSNLAAGIQKHQLPQLNQEDQSILIQRLHNLIYTQASKLNKQYFNSNDIEQTWQLYFSLEHQPMINENCHSLVTTNDASQHLKDLALIPKNKVNESYQQTESLSELDYLQMFEFYEYSRKVKLRKQQELERNNIFTRPKETLKDSDQILQSAYPLKKYRIEYKFGETFYIDQEKVAFFESKNTLDITVVSQKRDHIHDALLLARDKFGVVWVSGTDDFKRQVQEIARATNIRIEFDHPLVIDRQVESSATDKIDHNIVHQINEYKTVIPNSPPTSPTIEDQTDLINKEKSTTLDKNSKSLNHTNDSLDFGF